MFHRFHKFRSTLGDHQIAKIPADVKHELIAAALAICVAQAELRWPVDSELSLVDATPDTVGSVRKGVSQELALSIFKASPYRGKHVPFNSSISSLLEADLNYPDDPLFDHICDAVGWEGAECRVLATAAMSTSVSLARLLPTVGLTERDDALAGSRPGTPDVMTA